MLVAVRYGRHLSSDGPEKLLLVVLGLTLLRDLFAAVFFVFLGLATDPARYPEPTAARAIRRRAPGPPTATAAE